MPSILVCAALIERAGRYLLTQRPPEKARGLLWEFPGGKVEAGETPEIALQRELLEELAIQVQVEELFETHSHDYGDLHVHLLTYRCRITAGDPVAIGVHAIRWLAPQDMQTLPVTEADQITVRRLLGGLNGS